MILHLNRPVLAGVLVLAAYATAVFAFVGPRDADASFCLGFYLLLVLNSYFSISFTEAAFRVRCISDALINVPLVAAYLGLPWLLGSPLWFFMAMAFFFGLAAIKYTNWISRIQADFFRRRKITANTLASLECLLVLAALHFLDEPAWAVGIAFGLYAYGNVHTLIVDPLYREN